MTMPKSDRQRLKELNVFLEDLELEEEEATNLVLQIESRWHW